MKLIKVEYTGRTSQAIYANVTFEVKKLFRKPKVYTREVFLESRHYSIESFSPYPSFVDTGENVFHSYLHLSHAIQKEMIRQYELNKG